jgi:AraC-like DNA-binding protein
MYASAVAALFVDERNGDTRGVAIPRPEVHLVVRFGPATRRGLDVHALGGRQRLHRKLLPSGRTVTARLRLGLAEAVLGVSASAMVGRAISLEDLWSDAMTRRLFDRLADARSTSEAAATLDGAIAERFASARERRGPGIQLALDAADRLTSASVSTVAADLGVSERHLRRVFRETTGLGPKAFAKVMRFRRAVRDARKERHPSWAGIAAAAGYYDQAHLITEFRAIAGVTPQALLGELRCAHSIG